MTEKKRVLLVANNGLGNAGIQAVIMSIVRSLYSYCDFDVLLFTDEVGYYEKEFLSFGGCIYRVPLYEGKNRFRRKLDYYIRGGRMYRRVYKLFVDKGPYDVIHCNNYFDGGIVLKAAYKAGIPKRIMHTHDVHTGSNLVAEVLETHRRKMIEKYATDKIGCSDDACRSFYLNPSDAFTIFNSYDDKRFDRSKYDLSASSPLTIVQIGAFNKRKNQLFSIEVLNELKKVFPEAELKLVGFNMGNYEDEIKKRIKTLGLDSKVELLPHDTDTPLLLSKAACMLLPSLHEGFGIVLAEAQAMGVRCYASVGVPRAADRGGVRFIPLSAGPGEWARIISEDYALHHGAHERYDVSDFLPVNIAQCYKDLYEVR